MIAVLAATVLYAGTAFADHRPGNIVVMCGTLSLTGRYAAMQIMEGGEARRQLRP
jgi:hypothetical protein